MSNQINQYTKVRTAANFQLDDLFDVDATDDGGSTYESAKATLQELANAIGAINGSLYTGDGTLSGPREVDQDGNPLEWKNGTAIFRMYDFFINQTSAGSSRGITFNNFSDQAVMNLFLDQGADNGEINIFDSAVRATTIKGGFIAIGGATTGPQDGEVINSNGDILVQNAFVKTRQDVAADANGFIVQRPNGDSIGAFFYNDNTGYMSLVMTDYATTDSYLVVDGGKMGLGKNAGVNAPYTLRVETLNGDDALYTLNGNHVYEAGVASSGTPNRDFEVEINPTRWTGAGSQTGFFTWLYDAGSAANQEILRLTIGQTPNEALTIEQHFLGVDQDAKAFTETLGVGGRAKFDDQIAIGGINSGDSAIRVNASWPSDTLLSRGGNSFSISPTNVVYLNSSGGEVRLQTTGDRDFMLWNSGSILEQTMNAPLATSPTPNRSIETEFIPQYWDGAASANANSIMVIYQTAGGAGEAYMAIENDATECIRFKDGGQVNMSNLPTSSAGLSTGDLWNDAGTLKIV